MLRLPGRSATWRVLSMSFFAFLLRISTLTLELLSILMQGLFFFFFKALTFDLIDSTKFSSWFIAILGLIRKQYEHKKWWGVIAFLGCWCYKSSILWFEDRKKKNSRLLLCVFTFQFSLSLLLLLGFGLISFVPGSQFCGSLSTEIQKYGVSFCDNLQFATHRPFLTSVIGL